MRSSKHVEVLDPKHDKKAGEDSELKALLARINKQEKLAESRLEMVKLFLHSGKRQIAVRRSGEILEQFPASNAAGEAKSLMKK